MKILRWILLFNSVCVSLLSVPFAVSHHINISEPILKIIFNSALAFIIVSLVCLWIYWLFSTTSVLSYNTDMYDKAYKVCNVFVKAIGFAYIAWYFIATNELDRESMAFREILNLFWIPVCANAILMLTKKLINNNIEYYQNY